MCFSGSFNANEHGKNTTLDALVPGLGVMNIANDILNPKTKTKYVAGSSKDGFGSGMTSAFTNDSAGAGNAGNKTLYTDKASLTERVKGSIGANSIAGDLFGINGQRENVKYVLTPGKTVYGTKRVL